MIDAPPDRLHCIVPFCRRTFKRTGRFSEWICGPHWRLVSRAAKLAHRTAKFKALRDPAAIADAISAWKRCCAEATEAAAGVG